MTEREWRIGIVGTFDVRNYGDLLFPLIAEAELRQRLGAVNIHPFSYHAKEPPDWPYVVTSVADLPERLADLDAMLIGGGFIIRFDKEVAPDYEPPEPWIQHPTGYWLTPALMALQCGMPVVWNAPGMHLNDVPRWARPLLRLALDLSAYVAVRDEPSRATLAQLIEHDQITVVPDTGFGVGRLLPAEASPKLDLLWKPAGITGPYVLVQAADSLTWFSRFVSENQRQLSELQFVALPIGPVLGEDAANLPGFLGLPAWPDPLLLAELISHASAVVGHSYHLAITALACGVPVFTWSDLSVGKFTALRDFETVYPLSAVEESGPEWFLSRVGKREPLPALEANLSLLADHWDRAAAAIRTAIRQGTSASSAAAIGRFWQTLPLILEEHAPEESYMIDLDRIRKGQLEAEPYRWAAIDRLFRRSDSDRLARTFPSDHYKLVSGYGGEKDYEYEARELIAMGAVKVSHAADLSHEWRNLAEDFLSPSYRNALSELTGIDLSAAPLEVNVFHYGPGASLGAHSDLPDKIVTHVLYFNDAWDPKNGGCLSILSAKDPAAVVAEIPPIVGSSAVLVRSDNSWHAVSPVVNDSRISRRSLTATFYRAGSVSSMWPPGEVPSLHDYVPPQEQEQETEKTSLWTRIRMKGRFLRS
ncbi:MAG: polysaccharide pyruvyl transferase family protein [Acidobacteriota bacterium]|nr:polysaccharide pyruvyl transferase family protein [Acidobacteriota bacterium]